MRLVSCSEDLPDWDKTSAFTGVLTAATAVYSTSSASTPLEKKTMTEQLTGSAHDQRRWWLDDDDDELLLILYNNISR